MKITYTSPNASHHYLYAKELDERNYLYAMISGWPRLAPKSRLLKLKSNLIYEDFFQTLALLSGRISNITDPFFSLSNLALDSKSFKYAVASDIFLYYRTCGLQTAAKLKRGGFPAICIMEEVNSHVLFAHQLMLEEYLKLGLSPCDLPHPYDSRKRLDAYQISDYILCPSSFVQRSLVAHGIPPEKIIVNSFGMAPVSSLQLSQIPARDNDTFRILFVGQINIRKGLRYLVEAFKLLNHPNKELVIVGPKTPCTGLETTLIPDNVYFTGVLKGLDLREQFLRADVFVLPSIEEGMALVIGEALASGLPVVATTNTGAEDIMTHGLEGFIVEPCNSQALATVLQQLIDTPSLLRLMSANSYKTATSVASWSCSTSNLVSKFLPLVGSK